MIWFSVFVSLTMMQKLLQLAVFIYFVCLFVLVFVSYKYAYVASRETPPHNADNSNR